jgi:hypothetical protein
MYTGDTAAGSTLLPDIKGLTDDDDKAIVNPLPVSENIKKIENITENKKYEFLHQEYFLTISVASCIKSCMRS